MDTLPYHGLRLFIAATCIPFAATTAANTTVTIADASQGSGRTPATMAFPVTRSGDTSSELIVPYQTIDGTAVAPSDYMGSSSTITIPSGATQASIYVPLAPNASNGADATFRVQLLVPGASPVPSFAAQQSLPVQSFPRSVESADINADGRPDLVTANEGQDSFSVLLNHPSAGTLAFASQQVFSTLFSPGAATPADINGDGKTDVVVASNGTDSIQVFLNTTTTGSDVAQFSASAGFTTGDHPVAARTTDLNGDGRPDVIVANFIGDTVSVLLNTTPAGAASPSFAAQVEFAVGDTPVDIAIADMNGDGKPDILAMNQFDSAVSVLLNTTTAGAVVPVFAAQQVFAVEQYSRALAAADLNGDGKTDIAVVSPVTHKVSVLLNTTPPGTGELGFGVRRAFACGNTPRSIATADIDGDDRPDLVIANHGSDTISVLINSTAADASLPSFAAQQTFATDIGPQAVIAHDLDSDGKPDVVATMGNNTMSVLRNTQTGSLRAGGPASGVIVRDYLFGDGLE